MLFFVLLFSFIYGDGAIFILTWNASVIAVAIGNSIRGVISSAASSIGVSGATVYFQAVSLGSIRYLLHGVIEIGAYFVGGLAGGLISVAVIRYKLFDERFNKVLIDSMQLILMSAGLLLLAAVVEVFISPLIPA